MHAEGETEAQRVLVPKLRLGTHLREALLRCTPMGTMRGGKTAKRSFAVLRSQAELGNEELGTEGGEDYFVAPAKSLVISKRVESIKSDA